MLRFVSLCLCLLGSIELGFGQTGGVQLRDSNAYNPANWDFSYFNVAGEDSFDRIEWDGDARAFVSVAYRRDWTNMVWTRNGVIVPLGVVLAVPVSHQCPDPPPISMKSSGAVRVRLTWHGVGAAPKVVRLVLSSSAWSSVSRVPNYLGSAFANNGLGDGEHLSFGPPDTVVSSGKHLVHVDIGDQGVGEVTVPKSAEATEGGEGAAVFAHAHGIVADLDQRSVDISTLNGFATFYKPGPTTGRVASFSRQFPQVTFSTSLLYEAAMPTPVVPVSNGLLASFEEVTIGLPTTRGHANNYNPVEHDVDAFGVSHWDRFWEFGAHGTYRWFVERPTANSAMAGELERGAVASSSISHRVLDPRDCYLGGAFWEEYWHHHHQNDADTERWLSFEVAWSDGVRGEAARRIRYVDRAQLVAQSEVIEFDHPLMPIDAMLVVDDHKSEGGWILAGNTSGNFWNRPSSEYLWNIREGEAAARVASSFVSVLCSNPILKLAAVAISSGIEFAVKQLDVDVVDLLRDSYQDIRFVSGDINRWNTQRNRFEWKMECRPRLVFRMLTIHEYGSSGYEGTVVRANDMMEPPIMAWRRVVVRWRELL